jgi:hypothetical protein
LHVDLSVVPKPYSDFAKRYPLALNARITDIRKRNYSVLEVTDPKTFDGPVIVKSNLNSAGLPERRIMRNRWPAPIRALHRASELAAKGFGIRGTASLLNTPYAVYPNTNGVDPDFFGDPDIIVERFVPERLGNMYCHRRYYFLGGAEVSQLWLGPESICTNDSDGDEVHEIPTHPMLRRFRQGLMMDYGKIDYVHDDGGRPVILDVNKTPGGVCKNPADEPWLNDLCDRLESGLSNPGSALPNQPANLMGAPTCSG